MPFLADFKLFEKSTKSQLSSLDYVRQKKFGTRRLFDFCVSPPEQINSGTMYTLLFILVIGFAAFLVYRGFTREQRPLIVVGVALGILTYLFIWFMGFWGDKLWFDELGYDNRFWTVWLTKIGLFAGTFIVGGGLVYLLTMRLPGDIPYLRLLAAVGGGIVSGIFWSSNWETVLLYINRVSTNINDPVIGQDTGFYLFSYPFLQSLQIGLMIILLVALAAYLIRNRFLVMNNEKAVSPGPDGASARSIYVLVGILLLVLAFGRYIARYGILFSDYGIVSGPGWTDVKIRLPMLTLVIILTITGGILLIIAGANRSLRYKLSIKKLKSEFSALVLIGGSVTAAWLLLLAAVPLLFQSLKVEPNEITLEEPFIEHNIEFTRHGFHLDKVEKKEYDVSDTFSEQSVEENRNLFSNIRLWDYRALDAVFKQFQEIRLYYEFHDVDIDRYTIDNSYREVMVSAREMQPANLPIQSQTFVNKHFKYTHGYGAVLNLVNEFTPEGLPNLLIRDIPPVSVHESLEITRPEVYYGELTDSYVVVNSGEEEFDYPSGDKNMYVTYTGEGGVPVSNFWRKFLYGYKYGGTRFLLSGYPTKESHIMIYRQIIKRITKIAPFLYFDDDPYIVIVDGKMYWMLDAYTASSNYPYSEKFSTFGSTSFLVSDRPGSKDYNQLGQGFGGKNYLRNSVKVVIDAYDGSTDLYVFEEEDPLIQVYNKVFPGLLKNKNEMPESLREHVRYPADMLLIQGLVYAKYHMTDPTVFYNQEDLWVRGTEKYYNNVIPVEPYYIMWEPPGSDKTEFILMLPFTPKNKQVMIGWIAGMCDDENYGRFLAYQFPKEKRILGTQQVETKIDQDSYLSGQLTLWDQRGSNVIRGNVLAIPINNTMIYVEPIYLMSETSAYPELRLVAVMHNDNLSYAETFDEALRNLFTGETARVPVGTGPGDQTRSVNQLIDDASGAFDDYLRFMQEKNFNSAGDALDRLDQALQKLSDNE